MARLVPLNAYPACYDYGTDYKKRLLLRSAEYFVPHTGASSWMDEAGKHLYRGQLRKARIGGSKDNTFVGKDFNDFMRGKGFLSKRSDAAKSTRRSIINNTPVGKTPINDNSDNDEPINESLVDSMEARTSSAAKESVPILSEAEDEPLLPTCPAETDAVEKPMEMLVENSFRAEMEAISGAEEGENDGSKVEKESSPRTNFPAEKISHEEPSVAETFPGENSAAETSSDEPSASKASPGELAAQEISRQEPSAAEISPGEPASAETTSGGPSPEDPSAAETSPGESFAAETSLGKSRASPSQVNENRPPTRISRPNSEAEDSVAQLMPVTTTASRKASKGNPYLSFKEIQGEMRERARKNNMIKGIKFNQGNGTAQKNANAKTRYSLSKRV